MIDFTKPVQTREGEKVRIFGTDARDTDFPVRGEVNNCGIWVQKSWTLEGQSTRAQHESFLVNVPEERFCYLNVYSRNVKSHSSRAEADQFAGSGRISRLKIKIEDGRFDE